MYFQDIDSLCKAAEEDFKFLLSNIDAAGQTAESVTNLSRAVARYLAHKRKWRTDLTNAHPCVQPQELAKNACKNRNWFAPPYESAPDWYEALGVEELLADSTIDIGMQWCLDNGINPNDEDESSWRDVPHPSDPYADVPDSELDVNNPAEASILEARIDARIGRV